MMVYKIALYNDGITPQTRKYTSKGEVTSKDYPKSGVTVDIEISNPSGYRNQILFKNTVEINASAKYAILYNASKGGNVLLAYRLADGEKPVFEATNIIT